MRRITRFLLLIGLLLLLSSTALAAGAPALDWYVSGGAGGHAAAGSLSLDHTLGQAGIGEYWAAGSNLCSGFWCGITGDGSTYLPLVVH